MSDDEESTDPAIALPATRTDPSELRDSTLPPAGPRASAPPLPPPLPPPPRPPAESKAERPETGWSSRKSVLPPVTSRVEPLRTKDPIASTFAPIKKKRELARASRPPPPLRRDSVPPSHMPKPSEAPPPIAGLNPPERQRLAQLEKAVEQSRSELTRHRTEIQSLRRENDTGAERIQSLAGGLERAMADRSADALSPRVAELEAQQQSDRSMWEARLGGVAELAETASKHTVVLEQRMHRLEEGTEAVRIRMRLERVGHQLQGLEVRMEAMEERIEELREGADAARANDARLAKLESLFEEMAEDLRERGDAADTDALRHRVDDLEGLVLKSSEVLDTERAALAAQLERIEKLSASIPPPAPSRPPPNEDLTRIKGIGPKFARQLAEAGIETVQQIASWDDTEVERVASALGMKASRIRKAGWVASAQALAG
ncbi:MAG: helix-hairpin-helix domain-containing protein [Sandaracinaceae bacterium]